MLRVVVRLQCQRKANICIHKAKTHTHSGFGDEYKILRSNPWPPSLCAGQRIQKILHSGQVSQRSSSRPDVQEESGCQQPNQTIILLLVIFPYDFDWKYVYAREYFISFIYLFKCLYTWFSTTVYLLLERDINRMRFIAFRKIHYKDTNISLRTYKRIANLIKCKRIEDNTKYCFHPNPDSLLWFFLFDFIK